MAPFASDVPVPDALAVAGGAALGAVRGALRALIDGARGARLEPDGPEALHLLDASRAAWLGGIAEALREVPVLVLGVAPNALTLGEIPVLDGGAKDVPETLHRAGVRGVLVFAGATEEELGALARVLLTRWRAADHGEADLGTALWGLDLAHVHVERAAPDAGGPDRDGRTPRRLRALPEGLESAPEGGIQVGTLPEELATELRALRDTALPEPASLLQVHPTGPSPDLAAQARVADAGAVEPAALAEAVAAALYFEADPARAGAIALGVVRYALAILGDGAGPLLHALLDHLDPELSAETPSRASVARALRAVAEPPLQERLAHAVADMDDATARGELFSLFSLVGDEEVVERLARSLPAPVCRVLADAVLAREMGEPAAATERIRARLSGTALPVVLLGLAMASRSDEPRLIDAVLAHAESQDALVREAALYALRRQRSQRVRDLMRRRLDDAAEPVRLEALRYCVAWRDPEVAQKLDARVLDPALAGRGEAEVRALCIAFGRLQKEGAVVTLSDLARGRRRAAHPALPRFALHGLRAAGTPRAKQALQQVATEVPDLADEARRLLEREEA